MTKKIRDLILFLSIAFILPLLMIFAQGRISNAAIGFVLYGIQAAAPSVSAIAVLAINKELKSALSRLFRKDNLILSILLPVIIVTAVMILAKLISFIFTGGDGSFLGTLTQKQFIIVLWALVAEELGWRGYLEPKLRDMGINQWIVPAITGLIWCTWHYHYFWQSGIEVPVILFLISCIIESYVYSSLMRITGNNLVSAIVFHFMYNLMIHVFAVNPSDNNGSIIPYVAMTALEAITAVLLLLKCAKQIRM